MKLIHFGFEKLNLDYIEPIKNRLMANKPMGGFWTSPVDSKYSWKDWCEDAEYGGSDFSKSFIIELKDDAKILKIDSESDLLKLPIVKDSMYSNPFRDRGYLDFEKIASEYDAIWLTYDGLLETKWSEPVDTYGWDCESVLILNKNCIK